MTVKFGEFLRGKRLSLGKGLRSFCKQYGLDFANYSKIERGIIPPPSNEKLAKYAEFLQIEKNSTEWLELFDLACIARGKIPDYVLQNEEFVECLPLLFRKADTGEHYTKEELLVLADEFKKSFE